MWITGTPVQFFEDGNNTNPAAAVLGQCEADANGVPLEGRYTVLHIARDDMRTFAIVQPYRGAKWKHDPTRLPGNLPADSSYWDFLPNWPRPQPEPAKVKKG